MDQPLNNHPGGANLGLSRRTIILTCAVAASLACLGAGFIALISSGAIGGSAIGVAPQVTFDLVEPVLCQPGETLEFHSIRRSYHLPGESEPRLECVDEAGLRRDVLGRGILYVLGAVFLATWLIAFLLIAIPLVIAALLLVRWFKRRGLRVPTI
jgi:hypothetical protein